MKPNPNRNFDIWVGPEFDVEDPMVIELTSDIVNVRVNYSFDVTFVPFEPAMAPPFPATPPHWTELPEPRTPADFRLFTFLNSALTVAPYDPLAGQDLLYPSWYGASEPGDPGYGQSWTPGTSVMLYTSTDQYRILAADVEEFLETHANRNGKAGALELQGRPLIDFIVERLPASQLVPDRTLAWLDLPRAGTDDGAAERPSLNSWITRNFSVRVSSDMGDGSADVRDLLDGIMTVDLGRAATVTFVPFEPPMAPPFPVDPSPWTTNPDWRTPLDARLATFHLAGVVVTPNDVLAGQEFRHPRQYGRNNPARLDFDDPWEIRDGVVFYTSTEHYRTLVTDLGLLMETHREANYRVGALDLQGRPVIDFLVDRLQTSRLVPDRVLYLLGLRRSETTTK